MSSGVSLFDFSDGVPTGWQTGGPSASGPTYAFTLASGRTPSSNTGPSAGPGGTGWYLFAEVTGPRQLGDVYVLAHDGSSCNEAVSSISFQYHMFGWGMGTLRLVRTASDTLWSVSGDQGDRWHGAVDVPVDSPTGFRFEYVRGISYTGDAAIARVGVSCGPSLPPSPPQPPIKPPPPALPITPPLSLGSFADRAALLRARDAWCTDSTAAAAIYGPIGQWDVSRVTDLTHVFCACPISGCESSSPRRATYLPECNVNCTDFDDDISGWDTSRVTTLFQTFRAARSFNQVCTPTRSSHTGPGPGGGGGGGTGTGTAGTGAGRAHATFLAPELPPSPSFRLTVGAASG